MRLCPPYESPEFEFQTAGYKSAFPRRQSARVMHELALDENRGRRECRVTTSPMARLQKKSRRQSPQVGPDQPAFPARWFYGLYVLFSVTIAWLPPSPARRVSIFATLAPASERQNHTTSPSASGCVRQRTAKASTASRSQRP